MSKDIFNPMISVVIAFYNVEKYADYCMKSLILQDYDNCEFICVDDGSTDNTLNVLNKYSQDNRVKVYHKENGGLSDARNYGISRAIGQYVSIIDGDDYVHPHYLRWLANATNAQNDVVVISPLKVIKDNEVMNIEENWDEKLTYHFLDKVTVTKKILYDELSVSACAKLVPIEAYETIKFPLGKVSEEVATIGALLKMYEHYSIIDQPLYAYVMRSGSIGHVKEVHYKDISDRIESMNIFQKSIEEMFDVDKNNELKKAIQYRWGWRYVDMALMYDLVSDDKSEMIKTKKTITSWLHNNAFQILTNTDAPLLQRFRIMLYSISPRLYAVLYSTYKKIKYNL